jgi:hypothetical protein
MPVEIWILAVFLAAVVLVGLPAIRFGVHLPVELDVVTVPDHELTEGQARHYRRVDDAVRAVGYAPQLNFTVGNFQGATLTRVYTGAYDAAVLGVHLMRGHSAVGDAPTAHNYMEWITKYDDGSTFTTRNAEIGELFDRLPHQVLEQAVGVTDPVALKARHDARARAFLPRGPRHFTAEQTMSEFVDYHRRWCAFQRERGLLVPNADGARLHPTLRTALRGVGNFLNPLADNFTLPRFALAVAVGAGLPALAAWAIHEGHVPPALRWPALAAAVTAAGATAGAIFTGKAFIWSLVLGYVPLRLIGDDRLAQVVAALWMGFVAEWVARWRDRRRMLV